MAANAFDSLAWQLVDEQRGPLSEFLEWAEREEANPDGSMRWRKRSDIRHLVQVLRLFPDKWWAAVVYSCFDSVKGATEVAPKFQVPITGQQAKDLLDYRLPTGSIGGHRIRPGHKGAKKALVAACEHSDGFRQLLLAGTEFDSVYSALRRLNAGSWGRTTCFDLTLRCAALGIGAAPYSPASAYLGESTGPSAGFKKVWGLSVDDDRLQGGDDLLQWWAINWDAVGHEVLGRLLFQPPYDLGDFENSLCLFHGRR